MIIKISDQAVAFASVVALTTAEQKSDPDKAAHDTIQRGTLKADDYVMLDPSRFVKEYAYAFKQLDHFMRQNGIEWFFVAPSRAIIMTRKRNTDTGVIDATTRVVRLLKLNEAKLKELSNVSSAEKTS